MHQPRRSDRRESTTELEPDLSDFARRKGTALLDLRFQGLAMEKLHPHADPAIVLADAVDGYDPRMPHARQSAGLVQQGGVVLLLARRKQKLERDLALQPDIPSAPDLPGAPGAGQLQNC